MYDLVHSPRQSPFLSIYDRNWADDTNHVYLNSTLSPTWSHVTMFFY